MMRFGTWYKSGVEGEAVEDVLGRSQYESSIVELQLIRIGWDPFPVMLSPSADGSATLQNSDTGSPSRCNDI